MQDMEKRVIGKVMWRLIPFLIVCYFVAYLDRVNVGFAKLHMNQALGLSEAAFGLGAGLFFVGYFLFEVPSNIFLERVGARIWIARIMITWGIVSAAFAFIPSISAATGIPTTGVFYSLRLLLGACEAGFFPGIIFYLTLWFPAVYRAQVISLFMLAIPISSIIGSPISGMLLGVTGWGLEGWQWLFILEALPSVLVGIGVLIYLTDFPRQARWLQQDEIAWLENVQATEKRNKEKVEQLSLGTGAHGSAHFIVRSGVFLPECCELRRGVLPADHHQGFWRHRYPDRIARGAALCFRGRGHGAARSSFRSNHGTKRSRRRSTFDGHGGDRIGRSRFQPRHRHGVALFCTDRRLCGTPDVLAATGKFSDGSIGRRRHRRDQLAWKSFRFRRSLRDGLPEGFDRQLYRGPSIARGLRAGGRHRCRAAADRC